MEDLATPDVSGRTPGGFIVTPPSEISEPPVFDDDAEQPESNNLFTSLASAASTISSSVTQAAQDVLPESLGGHHERRDIRTHATDEGFDEEYALGSVTIADKPEGEATVHQVEEPLVRHVAEEHSAIKQTQLEQLPGEVLSPAADDDSHTIISSHSSAPQAAEADNPKRRHSLEALAAPADDDLTSQKSEEPDDEKLIDTKPTARVQESTNAALARARAILEKRRNVSGGSAGSAGTGGGRASPPMKSQDAN
jgi:hypothetical protein